MTISSTTAKNIYNGDGSTAIQPYTFRILNEDHIKVETKVTATDVLTTLVKTTDYTVSGVGAAAGGNITLVDAAGDTPTGTQIIITRNVPLTQASDYNENDPFPAQTIEDDLDKLLMENQQQQESLDRVIKLDAGVSGVSTTLPTPVASKLIGWDSAGTGLTSYSSLPSSGYTVVGSAGIGAYTDATTITLRTLTGTSNEITVADGDGVSGAPTLSLPTALTFTGKTVTGGTFASPVFSGTVTGTYTLGGTPTVSGALAIAGTAAAAASVTLAEDTDNGTNKITLIAPAAVTSDVTVEFKDSAGYPALDTTASDAWTAFTPGFTGFSANPSSVVGTYKKIGNTCHISITMGNGTSNTTAFTITSLPFAAKRLVYTPLLHGVNGGSGSQNISGSMAASGTTLTMYLNEGTTNWTASSTKSAQVNFTYETT